MHATWIFGSICWDLSLEAFSAQPDPSCANTFSKQQLCVASATGGTMECTVEFLLANCFSVLGLVEQLCCICCALLVSCPINTVLHLQCPLDCTAGMLQVRAIRTRPIDKIFSWSDAPLLPVSTEHCVQRTLPVRTIFFEDLIN